MNKLESLIYNTVKRNPRIKNVVRDLYQLTFSAVPVPPSRSLAPVLVREGYFFGFHDKNPWSADNRHLLAHAFGDMPNRIPRKGDTVGTGFFTGEDLSVYRAVATTSCFNWQQGSMLQWAGKTDNFLFNAAGGRDNAALLYDTEGRHLSTLPMAVAAVAPSGKKALSYNFARLQRHFPGYGYLQGTDPELDLETPASHGISIIDIERNLAMRLFSVRDIASFRPEKSMQGAMHFLTHCLFSPSGNRFVFLHRWIRNDNFTFTRMLSCDSGGGNLHLFPTHEMVSHIAWQDDNHVLAYCRVEDNRDAYILFRDQSEEFRLIGTDVFTSDGHPSFPENCTDRFITDTYPDRFRRSFLFLYDMVRRQRHDLGYFRQPLSYREAVRCDLHPRWNHGGTMICFDSAHMGRRSLCTMAVPDVLHVSPPELPQQ